MRCKPTCAYQSFLVFFFIFTTSFGQLKKDSIPKYQLELRHDNDFFFSTDRYYSSGLFIKFQTQLNNGIFSKGSEQLSFGLHQEVYTPSQTQSTNAEIFDVPYAGFSGFTTSWSSANQSELVQTSVLLGIAGLNSGAGGLQRWYHRALGIRNSPLWVEEIANSFHLNLYLNYVKEWKVAKGPFGVHIAFTPNLALGTKDIYLEPETILYVGKRNHTNKTIAYNRIGSLKREVYVAFRIAYRQVFYNGLIEGNLLGDNSIRTKNAKNSLYRFGIDFYNRYKKNDYKIGLHFNTQETRQAQSHKYVSLAYGIQF